MPYDGGKKQLVGAAVAEVIIKVDEIDVGERGGELSAATTYCNGK